MSTTADNHLAVLAREALSERASDIHLDSTGEAYLRINGSLVDFPSGLDEASIREVINETWPDALTAMEATGSIDRSATLGGIRVRANVSKTSTGLSIVMRLIPDEAPTLASMDVPDSIRAMMDAPSGIVLITGEFGSGKTTMASSLIDDRNQTHASHILCLEEPTEFLHRPKKSRITQREIPTHASTWADGIYAARRCDPDILFVGELRDANAVQAAMAAASSGILVLATLHAGSTVQALTALLGMVGSDQRSQVQTQIGQALRGVITQQLLPSNPAVAGLPGRIAAREVLVGTDTVRGQIVEGNYKHIDHTIEGGRREGMWMMSTDLQQLVLSGAVTLDTACAHTSTPDKLREAVKREAARQGRTAA
jgi:twitching motility protein PilT